MVLSPTRARHLSVEVRGDRETRGDGPKTSKGTLPLRTFLSGHSQTAMLSQTVVAICIVVLFFQGVLTYFFFNAKSSTLPPRHLQANEVRDNRRSVLMEIAPLTHTAAGQERLAKLLLQWYGVQIQLPQISGDPIEHRDFWNGTYIDGVFSQTEYIYQETRQSLSRAYEEEKTIAFKRASLSVPENKDGVQWRPEPWDETRGMYLWDWFLDSYTCHSRQRIGRVGDGGKWVCGLATMKDLDRCIVYSYGIRDDVSFELDLIARTGCEVHAFDPSIGALPDAVPDELVRTGAFTWHKQALSSVTGSVDTFMNAESLLDTMVRLGHAKLTLLKVDIEGSEWGVFSSLFSNARAGVGKPLRLLTDQLLIELHYRDVDSAFEFFEGMESEGFRIFSRETNYHPCVSGRGLPTAVEYSFIHPFFFRDFNRKRGSFSGNVAPTEKKKVSRNILRGVVFALVSTKRLRLLQRMMASLEKYFNRRWKYPIVLFTDEELPLAVQQSLVASSSSQLRFKKVSFDIPSFLEKERIPERTTCSPHSSTVGYRHMCRFMSQQVHQLLDDMGYSWHWRLDDDSILTADIGYDVFQFMENNGKKYGFVNTVMDGPECVKGLWEFTDRFLNRSLGKSVFYNEWPRGQVFYNNFEISHSSVWRSSRYRSFFEQVDREGGIYYNRWSDSAIKSIGVSLVVAESAIHRFSDIGYTHAPFVKQNGAFELEQMEDDKQPIAALKGTRFVPMKANDLQSRFMQDAGRHHWHGGDCATSFAIPSGRSLWLFGDSFVRSGMKQKLLRNTVSYFDGSKFEFLWRTKGAEVSEAIPLEALPNNEFWWIVAGLYYYEGKEQKAILLAQRVRATTEGFANVGYTIVGTTVLVVRNSYLPVNKWQYKWKNIPYTSARENWFSGISLVNGLRNISTSKLDEVYLVGNRGNPQSIHGSFQTLAKITVGALLDLDFSRMHVWSRVDDRGVGKHIWIPYISGHLHAPAALFSPAVSELSLTYHPHLAVWYVFVIQNGYLNLRLATTPTGPWDILPLMRIPYPFNNNALYHVYAAKSHPELAKETNMVVSYMVNSMTGLPDANASIYTPQFVRVELFSDFSRSPEFRPDCSACEHLPPDPAVFGHFAGLNCKCLDVAMGSAIWKRAYSNETRFVLFPDGPFHLSRLLGQSAILYLNLVKDVVLNRHYRDRPALIDGHDHPRFEDALTMIGSRRLDNLQALLETIIEHQIDGDFIETGAWRGGACLFAAAMFKAHHQWPNRRVFAADSFRGIPPVRPNIYPVDIIHEGAEKLSSHEQNSPELLKRQFELFGLWSTSQIRILPGYFNESLSLANSRGMFDKFALLRLDGDTYESTIEALDVLYPRLSIGGFVVVDDYLDWIGARQATLDFRRKHRIGIGQEGTGENLVAIYHAHGEIPRGVWWQKMRHVN